MVELLRVVTADVTPNQCKLSDPVQFRFKIEASSEIKIFATVSLVLDIAYVCIYSSLYYFLL